MPTLFQLLDAKFENSSKRAIHIVSADHEPKDLNEILVAVGSATELFLKDVIFNGARNSDEFAGVIDGLKTFGIPAKDRDLLHTFRIAYNSAKHDPNFQITIEQLLKTCAEARGVLAQLRTRNLGRSNQKVQPKSRRRFWFGAWDDFLGGITEIHLMLPIAEDEGWSPPIIDNIHIDIAAWEELKPRLLSIGLRLGPEFVPEKFYKQYMEGDWQSLAMGVFEGDYREMLSILGEYAKHIELLPLLKRGNDSYGMRVATLMSLVDIAEDVVLMEPEEAATAILERGQRAYGVPVDSKIAKRFADIAAAGLLQAEAMLVDAITGPFWCEKSHFREQEREAIYRLDELGACFMVDGRLLSLL